MNILYYGACWPTNVGNAFIDHGSIYTLKTAVPEATVYFASELPRWLYKVNEEDMDKSIDLAELMKVDFAVVSGMTCCNEFIEIQGPILRRLSKRGAKIVFNGCGGLTYNGKEIDNFKRFLDGIKVNGFISRDEIAYNNYKDYFPKSYNGIDCAFFLSNSFIPAKLLIEDYVVYNFDRIKEPKIENKKNRKIIRTHHSCFEFFPNVFTNRGITLNLRTRRPFIKILKHNMKHKDTLISDILDDYLILYANAYATYSDRVHACIATLSFGNFARLFSTPPSARLFERVRAGEITEKLVKLDQNKMVVEKEEQISFLREIFEE